MAKQGRPKVLKDAERRSIFVPDWLWEEIKRVAEKDGRSRSNWIRRVLERAVRL